MKLTKEFLHEKCLALILVHCLIDCMWKMMKSNVRERYDKLEKQNKDLKNKRSLEKRKIN